MVMGSSTRGAATPLALSPSPATANLAPPRASKSRRTLPLPSSCSHPNANKHVVSASASGRAQPFPAHSGIHAPWALPCAAFCSEFLGSFPAALLRSPCSCSGSSRGMPRPGATPAETWPGTGRRTRTGKGTGSGGGRAQVAVAMAFLPPLGAGELGAPAAQAAKWVVRLVSFYALLRLGLVKEVQGGAIDNAQGYLARQLFGDPDARKARDARKAAVKWKESTKGTLVRKLRVPSRSHGQKLLRSIASVLAEDDLFVDVASHKGCQVRRESAHSESVCCYNVRALFDELPTPHLEVEITVFPPGPLSAVDYQKAQKLEAVLRQGNSI